MDLFRHKIKISPERKSIHLECTSWDSIFFYLRSTRHLKKLFEMGQFELDETIEPFCLKSYPLIYFEMYSLTSFYSLIVKKAKWPIIQIRCVKLGYSIAFWNEVSVRVKSVLESAGFLSQISPPDRPLCPVWALERIHNLDLRTFSKIVITLFLIKAQLSKENHYFTPIVWLSPVSNVKTIKTELN